MPTYLPLSNNDFETITEADFLLFGEGTRGTSAGYFDTFSMLFGWWYSEPISYRYFDFGTFYIKQRYDNIYYIVNNYDKTFNIHTDGQVN